MTNIEIYILSFDEREDSVNALKKEDIFINGKNPISFEEIHLGVYSYEE